MSADLSKLKDMKIRPAHRQCGYLQVLGYIWQPGVGPCAMDRDLSDYDIGNIDEPISRETVLDWISLHIGDFQEILDFGACIDGVEIPWADDENELTYLECMSPTGEPCDCGACS